MEFHPKLFLKELLLYATTLGLGLAAAYRYAALTSGAPIIQVPSLSVADALLLAFIIVVMLFVVRFKLLSKIVFWLFLILVVFSGSQVVLDIFFNFPWDVIGAFIVLLVFLSWRSVISHDVAMVLGLAGIGAALGVSITPTLAIIALIILSFYDIIAVYKTRHMVKMAEGMIQTGAIFGFIIPVDAKNFLSSRREAQARIGEKFMILGSGDIGLPVIFLGSLMRESLAEAVIVAIFALIGVMLTHILFINQRKRAAMAALPPIATLCLVGYVVALLLVK